TSSSSYSTRVKLYKYTEGTQAWTVDAALQESRINSLTVSNDGYTDESWNAYQTALTTAKNKLSTVEAASYSSETNANTALNELIAAVDALETAKNALVKARTITFKYVTEDGKNVGTETLSIPESTETYTLDSTVTFNGNVYTVDDPTLFIGTADTYNVAVTLLPLDPDDVPDLTIEYWITNLTTRTLESTTTDPVISFTADGNTSNVLTANGADLDELLPDWTIKKDGDSGADREVEYWHVRMLDKTKTNSSTSRTEEQTTDSADDETTSGSEVTRVRYFNPGDDNGYRWQLLSGTNWLDVDLTDNQIVAYYMEVLDIQNENGTTELHVNAADWGKLGDGSPASSYADTNKYCSISLQIVYEDGTTTNPAGTTAADLRSKTVLFNDWDNGRGIGTFAFDTLGQFKIYQITAETGAVTATFNGGAWGTATVTNFTWDGNEKVVWSGDSETASIYNNTSHPSSTDPKDNLMWNENREAILVRVYVKATETPNSLTVHYIDRSANDLEFYNYYITTPENEIFHEDFDMTGNGLELKNNNVTNYYDGQERYVSADLQTMPEIKAYYRHCNYTLVDVERSADGKDVYLYYTFSPVVYFVADFGLPIQITPTDLNQEGYSTAGSDIKSVKVIGTKDTVAGATATAEYGTLEVSGTTVTYTPTQAFQSFDYFSVYVETTADNPNTTTNESAGINYRVYIIPATNVLYEEGFMTPASSTYWKSYKGDTEVNASSTLNDATNAIQSSANVAEYGYDTAYTSETDASNTTYHANISKDNAFTDNLSFTFGGNGFDLIGTAGPDTGTRMVRIYKLNDDNSKTYVKGYLVNTSFENETYKTIYQVPMVHFMADDDTNALYEVTVRGAYINYGTSNTMATMSLFAEEEFAPVENTVDPVTAIYELMYGIGLTDEQIDNVEFVNMDALYGVSVMAADGTATSSDAVAPT
ncbi:MAG: hypothetical protein J6C66_00115, partial [Prevotella sp.]|nr:hypothetical protein [Prevotella sp.]